MGETNITKYVYIIWDSFGKPNLSYWFTDCLYMWPVTQKGTSWVDDVISRKYVLKLTSRRAKIALLSVFQRKV